MGHGLDGCLVIAVPLGGGHQAAINVEIRQTKLRTQSIDRSDQIIGIEGDGLCLNFVIHGELDHQQKKDKQDG